MWKSVQRPELQPSGRKAVSDSPLLPLGKGNLSEKIMCICWWQEFYFTVFSLFASRPPLLSFCFPSPLPSLSPSTISLSPLLSWASSHLVCFGLCVDLWAEASWDVAALQTFCSRCRLQRLPASGRRGGFVYAAASAAVCVKDVLGQRLAVVSNDHLGQHQSFLCFSSEQEG